MTTDRKNLENQNTLRELVEAQRRVDEQWNRKFAEQLASDIGLSVPFPGVSKEFRVLGKMVGEQTLAEEASIRRQHYKIQVEDAKSDPVLKEDLKRLLDAKGEVKAELKPIYTDAAVAAAAQRFNVDYSKFITFMMDRQPKDRNPGDAPAIPKLKEEENDQLSKLKANFARSSKALMDQVVVAAPKYDVKDFRTVGAVMLDVVYLERARAIYYDKKARRTKEIREQSEDGLLIPPATPAVPPRPQAPGMP